MRKLNLFLACVLAAALSVLFVSMRWARSQVRAPGTTTQGQTPAPDAPPPSAPAPNAPPPSAPPPNAPPPNAPPAPAPAPQQAAPAPANQQPTARAPAPQPELPANQPPAPEGQRTHPVDDTFELKLPDGCTYVASIAGAVLPVQVAPGTGEPPEARFLVNLAVTASVNCPRTAGLQVSDNLASARPLSREELEDALNRRATVSVEAAGRTCVYVPDVMFTDDARVVGEGVRVMCPPRETGVSGRAGLRNY